MNDSKDSRIAVVTGANRGLGFETCRQLARRGMRVLLTARVGEHAEEAAGRLRDEGLDVIADACDVASDASVADFLDRLWHGLGRCDVLVNNAGAILDRGDDARGSVATLDVPAELVLRAVNVNALGAYRLLQGILPRMNAAGHGRVVNVSSGMGALTDMDGDYPAYRISKTALHAVTRVFHSEARGDVLVNAVCPGWVRTDMGGPHATRSVEEGARGIVLSATLPAGGPSGLLLRDGRPQEW